MWQLPNGPKHTHTWRRTNSSKQKEELARWLVVLYIENLTSLSQKTRWPSFFSNHDSCLNRNGWSSREQVRNDTSGTWQHRNATDISFLSLVNSSEENSSVAIFLDRKTYWPLHSCWNNSFHFRHHGAGLCVADASFLNYQHPQVRSTFHAGPYHHWIRIVPRTLGTRKAVNSRAALQFEKNAGGLSTRCTDRIFVLFSITFSLGQSDDISSGHGETATWVRSFSLLTRKTWTPLLSALFFSYSEVLTNTRHFTFFFVKFLHLQIQSSSTL